MEKENNPLVSVIVPCFNHALYVTKCIENIMNQTYKNIELVVIDDGSSDNSLEILTSLNRNYNFILVTQENHGIAYTLNRGIKEFCNGKYIAFCASDDYWELNKLELQVEFMEKNQFYPMCYGKNHYIDTQNNVLSIKDDQKLKGGYIFEDILLFKLHPPVTYLFNKDIFKEVGYYDENIFAEDYYMNLKIAHKYTIGFINEYLGYYRVDNSETKIKRFEMVSYSHLTAIENYRNSHLYTLAKKLVNLRLLYVYSGYKEYKLKSFKFFIKCMFLFYKKEFIASLGKLLLTWR